MADGNNGTDTRSSPAPIEGILPPLTSSNEVDVQLYAIVAIVIKDFVNAWYSKITPDRAFVDEVIQIIAHCSRALEQRIRQVDVTELILDELPVLVERHIAGKPKTSQEKTSSPMLTTLLHSLPDGHHCSGRVAVRRKSSPNLSRTEPTSST